MRLYKFILLSLLLLSVNSFSNVQIGGIWKHTQKPAWLEIRFESGVGSLIVKSHLNNVKAVGLNVIKDIKPAMNKSSQWNGQMYSAKENGYVSVSLILINLTTIAVYESSDLEKLNELLRMTKN
jgi:hypothetical protein